MTTNQNIPKEETNWSKLAEAALIRAQQRAHEKARQHGGSVVIWEDGKIVHIEPRPAPDSKQEQP